ncbi:MAG TPA: hypothetical protein VGQ00_00450 [Candidatus Norongarragalinales archaeon]|jgi:UDP-N-acetylglucosamine--dolichyl-phosphate N-acetylglucosaminephosphotransferase|nr:hypothetical protein [Candidatus Norongarragalinales archaeon]
MLLELGLSFAVAFVTCYLMVPFFVRFFSGIGVVVKDLQKPRTPLVPVGGGIPVLFAFTLGVLVFVAQQTFIARSMSELVFLFAALLSIFAIALVGLFDDLNVRKVLVPVTGGGLKDYKVGLKQWQKPLLTFFAAIPLMAVSAGVSTVLIPFIGPVNFGLLYPLLLVPLAVVFCSNATNMLAGMNGLEAGTTSVALAAVGLFALSQGQFAGAVIAFSALGAQFAFLFYTWSPAKILPGDSLTYFSGAAIVAAVILANIEKFGAIVFIPWIIEYVLKLRAKFKARSLGDLQKDGTLKAPYEKIYSLTHIAMKLPEWMHLKKRFTEPQVASLLIGFAIFVAAAAYLLVSLKIV